jgi:hypothetical protein
MNECYFLLSNGSLVSEKNNYKVFFPMGSNLKLFLWWWISDQPKTPKLLRGCIPISNINNILQFYHIGRRFQKFLKAQVA